MLSDFGAFQLVNNALQVADLRQQVYANNIANMNTPGYKREGVQFESALQSAMAGNNSSALLGKQSIPIGQSSGANYNWSALLSVRPTVTVTNGGVISNNGNNVDVEAEMTDLAENQIRYQALVQDLTDRISRLNTAIGG